MTHNYCSVSSPAVALVTGKLRCAHQR